MPTQARALLASVRLLTAWALPTYRRSMKRPSLRQVSDSTAQGLQLQVKLLAPGQAHLGDPDAPRSAAAY